MELNESYEWSRFATITRANKKEFLRKMHVGVECVTMEINVWCFENCGCY